MTLFDAVFAQQIHQQFRITYGARYCDKHNHISHSWVTLIIKISRTFKT